MFEWDFISNSCLCSLIPGLLGGNFSCIDYLSGAEELSKNILDLCVIQSSSFNTVKNLYREQSAPKKMRPVLELETVVYANSMKKRIVRNYSRKEHPWAFRGGKLVMEKCQSRKLSSHTVRNMNNVSSTMLVFWEFFLYSFFKKCWKCCRVLHQRFFSSCWESAERVFLKGSLNPRYWIWLHCLHWIDYLYTVL